MVKEVDVDGQTVTFMIWDSSGQERFQTLGTAFYRGSECCVLVFDVTSSKSFEALGRWRDNFFENAHVRDPEGFPVVVLGNKVDEDLGKREVSKEQAKEWCRANGNLTYFETSAKECINVEEALASVVAAALEQNRKDEK
uniref:Putative GTPase n=1 Tax=Coprinellus disseminatus TaxID=71703 RepID=Q1WMV3_COPDI|nr:putative GTPase [Coprinellus disseminatus]